MRHHRAGNEPEVRSYSVTHPPGQVRLPTEVGWDMVVYAATGALAVSTDDSDWVAPAQAAVCVGAGRRIDVRTRRPAAVRVVYLRAELGALPDEVRVVGLGPFARELLLEVVRRCPLDLTSAVGAALVTLLVDELAARPSAPLRLPLPADARAARLAQLVSAELDRPLVELMAEAGAGRRTFERVFRAEVGLSPAAWQRRARMLAAVELLAAGTPVTATSVAVGYATPSAFVAAFRREVGRLPSQMSGR